eukprot:PhM_4_TR11702/c1_g2_i1/m.85930
MCDSVGLRALEKAVHDAEHALDVAVRERSQLLSQESPDPARLSTVEARCEQLRSLLEARMQELEDRISSSSTAPQSPSVETPIDTTALFGLLKKSLERQERFEQSIADLKASIDTRPGQPAPQPVQQPVPDRLHGDVPQMCVEALVTIARWTEAQSKVKPPLRSHDVRFGESKWMHDIRLQYPEITLPYFLSLGAKAPTSTEGVGDRDTVICLYDEVIRHAEDLRKDLGPNGSAESRYRTLGKVLKLPDGQHALRRAALGGQTTLRCEDAFFMSLEIAFTTPRAEGGLQGHQHAEACRMTLYRASLDKVAPVSDQTLRQFRAGFPVNLFGGVSVDVTQIMKVKTPSSSSSYSSKATQVDVLGG